MISKLPIFLSDPKTKEILQEAASAVPKGTKVYIVGGAARNAVYYNIFRKKLPQRDYDLVCIKKKKQFINNLRKKGFTYGFIRRKDEITLLKRRVLHPKDIFSDNVFLDIHFTDEPDIIKNLQKYSGFTINAFAISLSDVADDKWCNKLITIPGALDDLKNKQLRLNAVSHPTMIHACIRFMSQGFKQPPKSEVQKMLRVAGMMNKKMHKRRIKKVFDYVGGEQNAKKLAKRLGIKQDIFDFKTILAIRKEVKKNHDVILI